MIIARYPYCLGPILLVAMAILLPSPSSAWFDETHLAIAKVAGYEIRLIRMDLILSLDLSFCFGD